MSTPDKCPLVRLEHFHVEMIRICTMHTVNLGIAMHINAQILLELIRTGRYGARGTLPQKLRTAWVRFKEWAKVRSPIRSTGTKAYQVKVTSSRLLLKAKQVHLACPASTQLDKAHRLAHSQNCFVKGMFTSLNEYPEMKLKAANSQVVSAWLASECLEAFTDPANPLHILYCSVTWGLCQLYHIMQSNPRILPPAAVAELQTAARTMPGTYICKRTARGYLFVAYGAKDAAHIGEFSC